MRQVRPGHLSAPPPSGEMPAAGSLIPIAERALSAAAKQKIADEFQRFEVEKTGAGHERAVPSYAWQAAPDLPDIKPSRCFLTSLGPPLTSTQKLRSS